jgi:glycosyltransferase involved in cell wall biosynthesis
MVHIPKSLYLHEPYRWLYEALPTLPWPALPPMESWSRVFPFAKTFIRDLIRTQSLRIQAREELRNVTGFDRVFVNSSFSRESVLRAFGLDATVLSLGVSTDVFRPDGAKRERFAVGVGSFTHAKGIDIAIRGIAAVRRVERPELVWICNIVSQGLAERLRSLADSLGVKLTLKIGIPDSEVVSALNRASMLLYTSRLEPFGFAPLEANACETPVVAIAEGGVRETIQHEVNGLLVPDYDPEKLGEAITRLLENPVFAAQLGKRGRQMVLDSWTWDSSVDNLERNLMLIANARKSFEAT